MGTCAKKRGSAKDLQHLSLFHLKKKNAFAKNICFIYDPCEEKKLAENGSLERYGALFSSKDDNCALERR